MKYSMRKRVVFTSLLILGLSFYTTVEAHRRRLTVEDVQTSDFNEGPDDFEDPEQGGRVSYKI